MGQEIKEQLKGIMNWPAIAGDALKHIEAQEKELEKVYSDLGEKESKNSKLESENYRLQDEVYELKELPNDLSVTSLDDEMRMKVVTRFYNNLTIQQLDELEKHAKENIVKGNYKDF